MQHNQCIGGHRTHCKCQCSHLHLFCRAKLFPSDVPTDASPASMPYSLQNTPGTQPRQKTAIKHHMSHSDSSPIKHLLHRVLTDCTQCWSLQRDSWMTGPHKGETLLLSHRPRDGKLRLTKVKESYQVRKKRIYNTFSTILLFSWQKLL